MKLKAKTRNALPNSDVAQPKVRKPIVTKGKLSAADAAKIRASANGMLGK